MLLLELLSLTPFLLLVEGAIDMKPVLWKGKAFKPISEDESYELKGICGKPVFGRIRLLPVVRRMKRASLIGGFRAEVGKYPWAVSIGFGTPANTMCTGTLISKRHVVTAAHCAIDSTTKIYNSLFITAGTICATIGSCAHSANAEVREVIAVMTPKEFSKPNPEGGDFAVLELDKDLQFSSSISPACLLKPEAPLAMGTPITHWGWGYESHHVRKAASQLQAMNGQLVDCKDLLFDGGLFKDIVCATGETMKTQVAGGDSGSGLEVTRAGRSYIIGTLSHECGSTKKSKADCNTDLRTYANHICNTTGVCYMMN